MRTTTPMPFPTVAGLAGLGPEHPVIVATTAHDGETALRAAQIIAAHKGASVVALSVVEPGIAPFRDPIYGELSPEFLAARVDSWAMLTLGPAKPPKGSTQSDARPAR